MGRKANPAIIGAFVIGAVALTVVAVTVWGSGKLFRRQYPCVCYFPGSVNGLSAGAPVKFRGVQIGEVTDVRLLYAQARGAPRVPVFLTIDNERMRGLREPIAPARRLLAALDDRTAPRGDGLRNVSGDTRQTLASLRATLESIQALVAPDAQLSVGLTQTVADLGRAAHAVGDLADFLERNPSAVVFGRQRP